jgi:predicted Ser/Thr protein kinase
MKFCPVCETDYPDDVKVCPQDGAAVRRPGERADPFVGRVIKGRYRVERQLGRGGMGTVYLAEQLSVGRKVALKVLRGDFARDDGFVARFQQEAKLVAGLNERRNPRVTLVHDFDQTEDGTLFIVMEWLEGRVLSEVIQRDRPLDLGRAVRLAIQIAEGLEAAHRANVVHRDVKPQNIMVLEAGDDIKLMDFGIARLRDSGTSVTRAGTMMGTPDYMAPEQIEGQAITEKTDLYSFGVVLYEMLTGTAPFRASTQAAVLTKQLQEQPVPPSRLRPEIPRELEAIVLKALEKDPANRERDMAAIVRALREISRRLGEGPVAAPPGGAQTIVVERPTLVHEAPAPTMAAPTMQAARTFTGARPEVSHDPAPSATVIRHEAPREAPAAAPSARPAGELRKRLAIGGAVAAVLVAAIATVVYLVKPPPGSAPATSVARPATPVPAPAPPQVSAATPGGLEIVPSRPPEPVGPPQVVAPAPPVAPPPRPVAPEPKPAAPEPRPGPALSKPAPAPRPPAPAPKPRSEAPPSIAAKTPAASSADGLRAQLEERLRSRGLLRGSGSDPNIGVTVEVGPNGVVTLRGIVRDATQRDEAAKLARMAGVSDVRLQVNVQSSWN